MFYTGNIFVNFVFFFPDAQIFSTNQKSGISKPRQKESLARILFGPARSGTRQQVLSVQNWRHQIAFAVRRSFLFPAAITAFFVFVFPPSSFFFLCGGTSKNRWEIKRETLLLCAQPRACVESFPLERGFHHHN